MLSNATETCETHTVIERYVMAAIVDARAVYTDEKWRTWADHWIAGRDRSFASARTAHRMTRQACDRVETVHAQDGLENGDTEAVSIETAVEMAAWAAGLALVTASVAPDLSAVIRRTAFALRSRLSSVWTNEGTSSARLSLAGRAVALARRAVSMLLPPEVPQTARL